MNTCETCCFWAMGSNRYERKMGDATLRECHCNPPMVVIDPSGNYKSLFPMVRHDDHCGLWEDHGQA